MARPKRLPEKDCKEAYHENFLLDDVPEDISKRIVVCKEIPKYEKIVFLNNRDPGETAFLHYHSKTHPLKHYELHHGQEYDLPVEFIKHLEGQNDYDPYACHLRDYGMVTNSQGLPQPGITGYSPYFQCRPVRKSR